MCQLFTTAIKSHICFFIKFGDLSEIFIVSWYTLITLVIGMGSHFKSAQRDSILGPLGMVVADISKALVADSALARAATMPPR